MSVKRALTLIFSGIFAILVIVAALTSWYMVDESEQAVVITFGHADDTVSEPGLHFKMPWPIQQVELLSRETFSLTFGYKQDANGEIISNESETKMITGDENIVLTDLVVQWKIADPEKYLFNSDDPKSILHNATSAAIRSVIGSSTIDEALTDGKAQIEIDTRELLTTLVNNYDIGVNILAVQLQDVEVPNAEVRQAFTAVTDARETQNTKENQAEKYKNEKESEAKGTVAAIKSKAEGDKIARIQQAEGDVAVFNSLYEQYVQNKEITRSRLILETLEQVLPNAKLYIMNDDGETLKYLPLVPNSATNPPVTEGSNN
ncbi:FtsH protease activity modulator HflK [Ureibacillus manganicus]|uniref:Protein HflK n=1 Tax=Ureibacillus manganicus DSM 26584 TaxID=1384049 RepID=A0A0A3I1V4_9BACL|nr:FtsH protease activity modulator HflK [Ureibacillus manganicus]KGR77485.1 tail fiber protein [Ureibacillus manganicus DSM 26584]